ERADAELGLGAETHAAAALFLLAMAEISTQGVAEQLAEQSLRIEHGQSPWRESARCGRGDDSQGRWPRTCCRDRGLASYAPLFTRTPRCRSRCAPGSGLPSAGLRR